MGGNAFEGLSRVTHEDYLDVTPRLFSTLQSVGAKNITPVGTTRILEAGDVVSDIDLAVGFSAGRDALVDTLNRLVVPITDQKIRKFGSSTVSLALPHGKKTFQVDIMVGNVEYLKWARFSDPKRSAVKGVVRNLFLNSWNRFNAVQALNERNRFAIDWERGLTMQLQTNVGKNGKQLKEWKTLNSRFVTDDPLMIMDCVLKFDNVCWTFEDVVNAIGPRPVVDAFFPVFLKELEVLLEQTPHLLGANPHKSMEEIRTVLEKLSSWTPR